MQLVVEQCNEILLIKKKFIANDRLIVIIKCINNNTNL